MSVSRQRDWRLVAVQWCTVVAALLGVLAVVFALWPARVASPVLGDAPIVGAHPDGGTAPGDTTGAAPRLAQTDALMQGIVSGNMFSATRRAPAVRFVAPGTSLGDTPSVASMVDNTGAGGEAATDGATEDGVTYPLLSGIVVHDGVRKALVQLSADDVSPTLFAEGDTRREYRIVRVGTDHVVIAVRGRTRTYRLRTHLPDTVPSRSVSSSPEHL